MQSSVYSAFALSPPSPSPSRRLDDLFISIGPQVCYSTISDKFSGLLTMCLSAILPCRLSSLIIHPDGQLFCQYPITNDFSTNPFRYRQETSHGSQYLLHAILALSCHFRHRSPLQREPPGDAINHKNTAMVLYRDALEKDITRSKSLSLLDTALALWQVDVS